MQENDVRTGADSAENEKIDFTLSESCLKAIGYITAAASGMQRIGEMVAKAFEAYAPMMEQIHHIGEGFSKAVSGVNTIDFGRIASSLLQMSDAWAEIVASIRIPTISEERKQQLIDSHKVWGQYGWTINPCADIDTLFDIAPESKKEADLQALRYCSSKMMPQIFLAISDQKRVKQSDYKEAVFDFEHKQYKSCALVLFSLIDAMLIRLQTKNSLGGKRRDVGKKAVDAAKRRAESSGQAELLFTAMFYTNLFSCLNTVFESGKDFKKQTDVINRNFITHGMMTRRVTRKNCVQLFLLYYNMLELLDMLY